MDQRKLTVLQVVPELDAGGVERGTLEVASELVRRGHRSLVVSAGGRLVAQLEAQGSRHFTCPIGRKSPFALWGIRFLRRVIREEGVDIIHVRSRVPAWLAWAAWKSLPVATRPRFVTTVHGLYSPNAYSKIMSRGEAVIAVSRTIRDYIHEHFPDTPNDRIRLIYRGVDPLEFPHGFEASETWRNAFFSEFPAALGRPLITLPGRITRLKGHTAFLHLLAELHRQGCEPHGLIVGGTDPRRLAYADELRQLARALNMERHVTFTGHRSDVREIFSLSHVVLSLSTKPESFGRTVLETLSLGVPVVGYDHGGVGEILADLFPQGAVPLGDRDSLTAVVTNLLRHPRRIVPPVTSYRLQTMLDQTLEMYSALAESCRVNRGAA